MKKIVNGCLIGSLIACLGCVNAEENKSIADDYIDLIKNYDNLQELAAMSSMHWESKCDCKIVYASKKMVSFKIESWSYTGGAHGMTNTQVGTVKNGRVLKLADLPKNIESLWHKALNSHPAIDTIKKYSAIAKPKITENFYLDDKGIHFIYQPYEIAPFAMGAIDIFVPGKFE